MLDERPARHRRSRATRSARPGCARPAPAAATGSSTVTASISLCCASTRPPSAVTSRSTTASAPRSVRTITRVVPRGAPQQVGERLVEQPAQKLTGVRLRRQHHRQRRRHQQDGDRAASRVAARRGAGERFRVSALGSLRTHGPFCDEGGIRPSDAASTSCAMDEPTPGNYEKGRKWLIFGRGVRAPTMSRCPGSSHGFRAARRSRPRKSHGALQLGRAPRPEAPKPAMRRRSPLVAIASRVHGGAIVSDTDG